MKLRLIPAGRFEMGQNGGARGDYSYRKQFNDQAGYNFEDESPMHPVRLTKPFYMGETEVTVGQFKAFIEATGYRTTAEASGKGIDGFQPEPPANERNRHPSFEQRAEFTWRNPGFEQKDDQPVVGVSWEDAQAYCKWLSEKENTTYRLPTEAEWEYACRAGSETWFNWGDSFDEIHKLANIGNAELEKAYPKRVLRQWLIDLQRAPGGDGHVFTAPVGSFPANKWGLRDMHGNVWEWCQDYYNDTFYQQYRRERYNLPDKLAIDPVNDKPWNEHGQWRVIRGGCWFVTPVQCRSQTRGYFDAPDAGAYLGFRVVRQAPQDEIALAQQAFAREQEAVRKVVEASGPLRAGENHARDGIRVVITPQMNVSAHLRHIPGVTEVLIDRSNEPVTAQHILDVAAIKDLRKLIIYTVGDELRDGDPAPIASKTSLVQLDLRGGNSLTDAMLAHVAGLTELRELTLDLRGLTDEGLGQLSGLKKLESLSVVGTQSTGAALSAFEGAPLRKLNIWKLTDEGSRHLRLFPQMREMSLINSPLTDEGFAHIATLKHLESVDLTRCKGVTDAAFSALAGMRELRGINLQDTGAGNNACKALASHIQLTNLHIGSPALTDAGLQHLSSLVGLQYLSITESAAVTDRGLRHLWRLDRLNLLSIGCPKVTGEGLRELMDLSNLRRLHLTGKGITDEGLKQVRLLAAVEELRIGDRTGPPAVTDAGLITLAEAAKLRRIIALKRRSRMKESRP